MFFGKSGDQVATAGRYIETSTGAYLSDGGAWTNSSDRDRKEHFRDEDAESVLARIATLPIQSWTYKAEDSSIRHLGPTAQDFYAAFGLGDSDKAIPTVDIDGVNMLAIQALEARTRDLDASRAELAETQQRLAALATAVERLVAGTEVD
ncbi:MAG: tail fiber domain-containing protein, partial [Planctomycetes bacterium]|nr:tail fiber domain-containing protein [Planctomycetota bacterium]